MFVTNVKIKQVLHTSGLQTRPYNFTNTKSQEAFHLVQKFKLCIYYERASRNCNYDFEPCYI